MKRKATLRWKVSDTHGIDPALCMHKSTWRKGIRKIAQYQWRLNPVMKDVVRNEVIKWVDAGIVYSISYSKWVSPI